MKIDWLYLFVGLLVCCLSVRISLSVLVCVCASVELDPILSQSSRSSIELSDLLGAGSFLLCLSSCVALLFCIGHLQVRLFVQPCAVQLLVPAWLLYLFPIDTSEGLMGNYVRLCTTISRPDFFLLWGCLIKKNNLILLLLRGYFRDVMSPGMT